MSKKDHSLDELNTGAIEDKFKCLQNEANVSLYWLNVHDTIAEPVSFNLCRSLLGSKEETTHLDLKVI